MNLRVGRLRIVDLLLFASGALQLHLLFTPGVFKFCGGALAGQSPTLSTSIWASGSALRWVLAVSGALALSVLPLSLIRSSAASALAVSVFLIPLSLFNCLAVLLLLVATPTQAGWGECADYSSVLYLVGVNAIALFVLAIASLRNEGRGLSPDSSPEATTLTLGDAQPNSQSE
jgi:hypothetical protein